jgi:predicted KAP-like P-loop ATPase
MVTTDAKPLTSEELSRFQVILDEPAHHEKLSANFDHYASALADIVVQSSPQFAVGIFGDWGSGKTTLMRAIGARIESDETIPVWFNAWRFEKEQHLIVPLLDTLAAELLVWGKEHSTFEKQARDAAKGIGRATSALMAGWSLTVGWPIARVGLDAGRVREAFRKKPNDREASFYFTSLTELERTLKEFVQERARRIVVFVDDLDRCLPQSALEVLESMKLFFDMQGFVFVVGLDRGVIERSVEVKYQPTTPSFSQDSVRSIHGSSSG